MHGRKKQTRPPTEAEREKERTKVANYRLLCSKLAKCRTATPPVRDEGDAYYGVRCSRSTPTCTRCGTTGADPLRARARAARRPAGPRGASPARPAPRPTARPAARRRAERRAQGDGRPPAQAPVVLRGTTGGGSSRARWPRRDRDARDGDPPTAAAPVRFGQRLRRSSLLARGSRCAPRCRGRRAQLPLLELPAPVALLDGAPSRPSRVLPREDPRQLLELLAFHCRSKQRRAPRATRRSRPPPPPAAAAAAPPGEEALPRRRARARASSRWSAGGLHEPDDQSAVVPPLRRELPTRDAAAVAARGGGGDAAAAPRASRCSSRR